MKSDKHGIKPTTKRHKQPLKKTKHFITKPKLTKFSNKPTCKTNLKLFSLQHQTLNLLRKVNKLKINQSKSLSTDSIEKNIDSNKSAYKLSSNNNNSNAINKQKILEDLRPISSGSKNNDIDNKKLHVDKKLSKKKHLRLTKNNLNENYDESTDVIVKEIESQYTSHSSDDTEMKINIQKQRMRKRKLKKQLKAKSHANNEDDCAENEINEIESIYMNENLADEQHVSNIGEPENLLFKSESNIDFFQFNKTQVLLTLVHPCSLYLIGILEVEVFFGTVDVLGYKLDRNCGKNTLYSLKGSSHLCLTTKENNRKSNSENLSIEDLLKYGVPRAKVNDISSKYSDISVILILNKCESNTYSSLWTKFIEKYSGNILLPHVDEKRSVNPIEKTLDCEFQLFTESTKLYCEMPQWEEIADVVKAVSGRTMICGGKGVGKSTFLRYLINHSLPVWKKVLVIDLDPGQSEFMAPGLLSAFIITSPLLGPSFTHVLDPIKSLYFGITDVGQNLKKYFVYVQHVLDYCSQQDELKDIPWLINTMGFNKGIGVLVTSSVIKKMAPSILVQIECQHKARNFPDDLTSEFVKSNILDLSRSVTDTENLEYRLFKIPSAVRNAKMDKKKAREIQTWGLSAASGRNIMILAYFGQMLNSDVTDIFQIEPYVVDISSLFIEVINENLIGDDLLDAINGSLVALCFKVDLQDRSHFCHGFGIVRAVDKVRRKLFLLTPLKEDKLQQVNSLVKGVITLPDKLYSDPSDSVSGQVPYVSISKNMLSCTVKNTFKKVAKT